MLCSCSRSCPCFAHCCHDPFIVRNASNFSTFPRFHSVCASVSMFTINIDNCLFLFLCKCLRFCNLGATSMIGSHQVSVHLYRGCNPATRSIVDFVRIHLVVECWIHGLVEHPKPCNLSNIPIFAQFFSSLILKSSFLIVLVSKSIVHLCVPFDGLLPIDPSKNSPFLKHSMLSRSESTLPISK